jgi:hypothetical protein
MASAVDAMAPSFDAFAEEDAMTGATGTEIEDQLESDDEDDDFEAPGTGITVATHGPTAPTVLSVVEVTEPTAPTEPTPEPATAAELVPAPSPVELAPEPTVTVLPTESPKPTAAPVAPVAEITLAQIDLMDKPTAIAHCKARGIDTKSKGQVQLKDALRASLSKA